MIVFVTTAHHAYTVAALAEGRFGLPLPPIRQVSWDALWRAEAVPRATWILTDMERLTAHERLMAAEAHAALRAAGLRCLNDPAQVPGRHALLLRLHAAGVNPFRSWRAEEAPRPACFPVFLRQEADHGHPMSGLIADQAALEAALAALPVRGVPLEGVLVVEFCAEPIAPGTWQKFGTFRIGDTVSTDHAVIEDGWCVKYGTIGLSTQAMQQAEHDAVAANGHADALRPVFDLARVEWGRADHATVGGREVVYEINTNPHIHPPQPQRLPIRDATLALSRARMAAALHALDTPEGRAVTIEPGPATRFWRDRSHARFMAFRP